MNKKTFVYSSIAFQLFILIMLATGADMLTTTVFGGALPWGNLLTAMLLVLFPMNFVIIRRGGAIAAMPLRVFRACVYLAIVQGAAWPFVSYSLSGNWAASFSSEGLNQQVWLYYTYITALLPFVGYFLMKLLSTFYKK